MTSQFPASFDFQGYNAPSRIECEVYDLVIEGLLPAEINGSWFQAVPDPQYPPFLGLDTYLSGDGMVRLLRFENGHVDLKQRYIRTERFKNERRARRSLYGLYRNPYTDDPSVQGKPRNVNNTTMIFHGGRLLALKEDSHAMQMDPDTLETVGIWNYRGKLRSRTMTAHTRPDLDTGELYFFGYEASGLASRDVAYCVADKHGELIREEWFQVPYCALMHDFVVTKQHVIFPVFPTTADLARIKAGGAHWVWDPTKDTFMGIMPRDSSVRDLRWFRAPARSAFHFMNAYTEGSRVHVDFGCGKLNPFPFIREASGIHIQPQDMVGSYVRWTFDLSRPGEGFEETVIGGSGDMPRVADKDAMRDYEIGYYQTFDPTVGPPLTAGPVGAGFNTILRLEVQTNKVRRYAPGPTSTVQEHFHIPSATPGHEGYLAFIVDQHAENLSEVFVLEAGRIELGPLARIKVPFRLRVGVHGNWVDNAALR